MLFLAPPGPLRLYRQMGFLQELFDGLRVHLFVLKGIPHIVVCQRVTWIYFKRFSELSDGLI
jgi:hypothetical protein